jgi:hypothetical protein
MGWQRGGFPLRWTLDSHRAITPLLLRLAALLVVAVATTQATACSDDQENSSDAGETVREDTAAQERRERAKLRRERQQLHRERARLRREREQARRERTRARRARAAARREQQQLEAQEAPPPESDPSADCHPSYDPCLDPNAIDYDCEGGSGDGPNYTGPVTVKGPDDYDLNRDGDNMGCDP